ncbi:L-aspartate dehydrogenase [Clostridia bacterium]|nr:L-aspartate dehydrogenase [Clostridia bacterium]
MAGVGFLGCGTIGKAMVRHILDKRKHSVAFIQDPFYKESSLSCPVVSEAQDDLYAAADLVVECATADVLKQNIDICLRYSNLLVFSITAFSDEEFYRKAFALSSANGTHIYFPHGAILGLDGIFDAREILKAAVIETTKNPKSLGRNDITRTIAYVGSTREACRLYPRNVNVHAAVALAGLGFDATQSRIISDPAVSENSHNIQVEGDGIRFRLEISSPSNAGITGLYTPVSACGSLDRILSEDSGYIFV